MTGLSGDPREVAPTHPETRDPAPTGIDAQDPFNGEDGLTCPMQFRNCHISLSTYEAEDSMERYRLECELRNGRNELFGTITVTKIDVLNEAIALSHILGMDFDEGSSTMVGHREIERFLSVARSSGYVVTSSIGTTPEEIVSAYGAECDNGAVIEPVYAVRMVDRDQMRDVTAGESLQGAPDQLVWIDISARIPDSSWNSERLREMLKHEFPRLFEEGGMMAGGEGIGYLYLDHRVFETNPENPVEAKGRKVCAFLAPSLLITVSDRPVAPLHGLEVALASADKEAALVSPGGAYLNLLEHALNGAESMISSLEKSEEQIQRQLARKKSLPESVVAETIPLLKESFGYVARKLLLVVGDLETCRDWVNDGRQDLFGGVEQATLDHRIRRLERFATELREKALSSRGELEDTSHAHRDLVAMRRESITFRTAILEAATWPPLIALATIQVLSVLAKPTELRILTAGILTSVALLAVAAWKRWGR